MGQDEIQGVQKYFDSLEDYCEPLGDAEFSWESKGFGFGRVRFYTKDGTVYCDNEMMSKEFIKELLCKMVDSCEMDIPNKKDTADADTAVEKNRGLIGVEENTLKEFKHCHMCPDVDLSQTRVSFDTRLHYVSGPIGTAVCVECTRCGCKHDITDYSEW